MLWLLALIPILAAPAVFLRAGERRATLGIAAAGVLAATLALAIWAALGGWSGQLAWSGALRLQVGLTDFSAVMAILVPAVALPVVVYATAHEDSQGLKRLIALLLLFVGAMELLVIAADLLTLLIGWELVGACSWALISHRWRDADNPAAGRYAFVATRLGDLGLFLAAMAAFTGTRSFAFAGLGQLDGPLQQLLVFGVLLSAAAKSGQVPFAPWLFRAMAGPTSVSALLHAATMVAAGAYLLIRLHPVLDSAAWFGPVTIGIGLVTALAGGTVTLLQPHAKKLLAASTSAQYGLMFVAVGAGYPGVALAHMVSHAAFKALLFLGAGIAGEQAGSFELSRMRFARTLPYVTVLSAAGALALAGVPPLGAAWTKEAVIAAAAHAGPALAIALMLAGGLSAAYAMRFQYSVFGPGDEAEDDAKSSYRLETVMLALLAVACVVLGALWLPGARGALEQGFGANLPLFKPWETIGSLIALAAGLYAGLLVARHDPALGGDGALAASADWLGLPVAIHRLVVAPTSQLAQYSARFDDHVIDYTVGRIAAAATAIAQTGWHFLERLADGLPEGSARWVALGGEDSRRLQTGLSHHYFALIAIGVVVLTLILLAGS